MSGVEGSSMPRHDCENCAKARSSPIRVDFEGHGPAGYDFDCDALERMTDKDVEWLDMGLCPYYEPIDRKSIEEQEQAMYEDWLESEKEVDLDKVCMIDWPEGEGDE